MNTSKQSDWGVRPAPQENLESPFLSETLFAGEAADEWEARLGALEAESPYQTLFTQDQSEFYLPALDNKESFDGMYTFEEPGIINGDNRLHIEATTKVPWRWICKIVITSKGKFVGRGTGVLISDRHVLTAAHVVYDVYKNKSMYSVDIIPALDGSGLGAPFGSYSLDPEKRNPKIPKQYVFSENKIDQWDYALLTLTKPIGSETFAVLDNRPLCYWGHPQCSVNSVFAPLKPVSLHNHVYYNKRIYTAGYPKSKNNGTQLWRAISETVSFGHDARTIHTMADITEGQSGSPMWVFARGKFYLVGIVVTAGSNRNAAVHVTRDLIRQVRTWIIEDGDTPTMSETEVELESPQHPLSYPTINPEAELSNAANTEWLYESSTESWQNSTTNDRNYEFSLIDEPPVEEHFDATSSENEFDDIEEELESTYEETGYQFEEEDTSIHQEENINDESNLDFEHLGILDFQVGPPVSSATLGFEFDLNYGFEKAVTTALGKLPPIGFEWPNSYLKVTNHEWKDSLNQLKDGFVVTMDAVRMEIATTPFHIDDDLTFSTIMKNVTQFGHELIQANKKPTNIKVSNFQGQPILFEHPRTVVNKPDSTIPGDRELAIYKDALVPLVIHRVKGVYPTRMELWASPQATLTLPLSEVGKLIWEIHRTKGGIAGEAFTGPDTARLGLRDDLAWLALKRAMADRKKKLGTLLSDGTTVTEADFTRSITCLVTILLMYMLTSIKKDKRDPEWEDFAKGSLPLNVKTPLWQIHKFALSDREKFVFHELYTDSGKRENLYILASGTSGNNGSRKLFPDYTHWDLERFHANLPTWDSLVDSLVKDQPIKVTKDNKIAKKGHRKGDEILIAPLSSKLDWSKTQPRIAVEMRRIGFKRVPFAKWPELMRRLRVLAQKVNEGGSS